MALNFWDWLLLNRHERQMMRHVDRVQNEQLKATMQMQGNQIKRNSYFGNIPDSQKPFYFSLYIFCAAITTFFVALFLRKISLAASITFFVISALCALYLLGVFVEKFKKPAATAPASSDSFAQNELSELEKFVATHYPAFEIGSKSNELFEIVYEDKKGNVSKRKIEYIATQKEGKTLYLLAFCHTLSDFARFELDHIIQIKDKHGKIIENALAYFSARL